MGRRKTSIKKKNRQRRNAVRGASMNGGPLFHGIFKERGASGLLRLLNNRSTSSNVREEAHRRLMKALIREDRYYGLLYNSRKFVHELIDGENLRNTLRQLNDTGISQADKENVLGCLIDVMPKQDRYVLSFNEKTGNWEFIDKEDFCSEEVD